MTEPDPAAIRDPEAPSAPSVCTGGEPTAKRDGCERCERCEIFDPARPRVGDVCGACGDGRYRAATVAGDWANATVALTENISVSLPIGTVVFLCERCDHLVLRDGNSGRMRLIERAFGELSAERYRMMMEGSVGRKLVNGTCGGHHISCVCP